MLFQLNELRQKFDRSERRAQWWRYRKRIWHKAGVLHHLEDRFRSMAEILEITASSCSVTLRLNNQWNRKSQYWHWLEIGKRRRWRERQRVLYCMSYSSMNLNEESVSAVPRAAEAARECVEVETTREIALQVLCISNYVSRKRCKNG